MSRCHARWRRRLAAISFPPILFSASILPSAVALLFAALAWSGAGAASGEVDGASQRQLVREPAPEFEVKTLRGRVVWLAEAMTRRHGVKTVPESAEAVLALETAAGQLHPLVEDIRGRGFRRDERLRNRDLELLVRQYRGAPVVQVIGIFERTAKEKFELDYWCDICAIAMYELKPCDCCQGDIALRRRVVGEDGRPQE